MTRVAAGAPEDPLLTIVIPAFDAEDYLARALHPLLAVRAGVEVIVVDDGSRDGTAALAERFATARPDLVRVVRKANGGHGSGINIGITQARGRYFKVLDADDWLDVSALRAVLTTLRRLERHGGVDALLTDYVHERVGKSRRTTRFSSVFPAGRTFGWDETERFSRRQYLMMHAAIFRTRLLRDTGVRLPEHTFYVDSLYVLAALAEVRLLHYLPVPLYRYFIGRADQSVQPDVMLARVDQQLRVTRLAIEGLPSPAAVSDGDMPPALYACLLHHLEALCAVTSATLARGGRPEHLARRAVFWSELREENPWVYTRMRRSLMGASANLPGQAGRRMTSLAYHVARRVVGFS